VSDHDALQRIATDRLLLNFSRNGAFGPGGAPLLVLERSDGPYVWDTSGRRYIDALSGLISCQLGGSFGAELAAAAAAQMDRLGFAPLWSQGHPAAIELAERLAELAPGEVNQVFFVSGGGDAVESAWKLARLYHTLNGEPQRTKAIARRVAYHGATIGSLPFTGIESYRSDFHPLAAHVRHVSSTNRFRAPDGDEEGAFCRRLIVELEQAIVEEGPETVGMIIAEPVQNAGGAFVPPRGYWKGLRAIADRYGILLVADEVITGFGRLGWWFGGDRYGARPDLIAIAKGLTSSYAPMGAVLVADRIGEAFRADPKYTMMHGLTFGGHPLCAAVALKNLEILEREGINEHVRALEPRLEDRLHWLAELPIVGDVRGAGFLWAVELVKGDGNARFDAAERDELLRRFLPRRLLESGIITRADDRGDPIVYVAPPLICDADVLDTIVNKVGEALDDAGRHMGVAGARPVTATSKETR
jgi:adenosylmethionine-8-amino-7-oxononanoate aminotransferase